MKSTKKLTLSSVASALGVVLLTVGGYLDFLELSLAVLASLLVVFVYLEIGSPYTWLVWLVTGVLTAVFNFASPVWLSYLLLFGIYPIAKGYIERLPRIWWLPLKLIFVNLMLTLCVVLSGAILGLPYFGTVESLFGLPPEAVYVGIWVLMNVAFLLYDIMLLVMIRFYMDRIRPKLRTILK